MAIRKFKITLDEDIDIDTTEYYEHQLKGRYLKQTILALYFYENGVELNQDIQIKEITDEKEV